MKSPKKNLKTRSSAQSSPGWTAATDLFKSPPKSASPKRRVTRRTSMYHNTKTSENAFTFRMPLSKVVSPPGVKTRARRSSIYQKGGGKLLSPKNTRARRTSMYVSSKAKTETVDYFSKVWATPIRQPQSIAESPEVKKPKGPAPKKSSPVKRTKTPKQQEPETKSVTPKQKVSKTPRSTKKSSVKKSHSATKSRQQSPAKKTKTPKQQEPETKSVTPLQKVSKTPRSTKKSSVKKSHSATKSRPQSPAKKTKTPKQQEPESKQGTPQLKASKTPRSTKKSAVKKSSSRSAKKSPRQASARKTPRLASAKKSPLKSSLKKSAVVITSTPTKSLEEITGKSFYATPGETPIVNERKDDVFVFSAMPVKSAKKSIKARKSVVLTPVETPKVSKTPKRMPTRKTPAVKRQRANISNTSITSPVVDSPVAKRQRASAKTTRSVRSVKRVVKQPESTPKLQLSPVEMISVLKSVERVGKRAATRSPSPRPSKMARKDKENNEQSTPRVFKTAKRSSPKKLADFVSVSQNTNNNQADDTLSPANITLLDDTINTDSRSGRCIIL